MFSTLSRHCSGGLSSSKRRAAQASDRSSEASSGRTVSGGACCWARTTASRALRRTNRSESSNKSSRRSRVSSVAYRPISSAALAAHDLVLVVGQFEQAGRCWGSGRRVASGRARECGRVSDWPCCGRRPAAWAPSPRPVAVAPWRPAVVPRRFAVAAGGWPGQCPCPDR